MICRIQRQSLTYPSSLRCLQKSSSAFLKSPVATSGFKSNSACKMTTAVLQPKTPHVQIFTDPALAKPVGTAPIQLNPRVTLLTAPLKGYQTSLSKGACVLALTNLALDYTDGCKPLPP